MRRSQIEVCWSRSIRRFRRLVLRAWRGRRAGALRDEVASVLRGEVGPWMARWRSRAPYSSYGNRRMPSEVDVVFAAENWLSGLPVEEP